MHERTNVLGKTAARLTSFLRVAPHPTAVFAAAPRGSYENLIGAYVLAGELAAAAGAYQVAFRQYEKEMRPFVRVNQALGIKSAKLMRSKENSNLLTWLTDKVMNAVPGRMLQFFIDRSTRRIQQAAIVAG